ncbi:tRNA lysidine(34) synthetase TilS [Chitinophagaceae bacterium IBVUCB2]|nr:tRNA lysidine(34) synthetase TilS [Chitinophagaceae bacterium IBVUCB2]
MDLLVNFKNIIKQQHLFSPKDKLLLAVSGGVDSVVLCELCKQGGYDFSIAHCNFQLRGEESERDEQFVRELGRKYEVEVLVKEFDTEKYATDNKLSTQEAARNLRYKWFEELVLTRNSKDNTRNLLLTAHHADDNNETLLMNFFRGTGLHGLTGIPAAINYIRRPLLTFSKDELVAFAKESNLNFVEDSSNQSSKYTRNFFRNELVPAISKVYPQVKENLQDNIKRFTAIEKLYRSSVDELKKKLCRLKGNETHIPVKQLMGYNNSALIYEIISPFGFNEKQVDEMIKLATSQSGKYIHSPGNNYRIIKHRHWFIISPVINIESDTIIIEEAVKEISFALGILKLEKTTNSQLQNLKSSASFDSKKIKFPLLLRKWKTGDYFYPLGMKKKKKLNRFFIDQKLSRTEKENAWVLESNQRIVWVVNHRIDDRYKVTDKTKEVLRLQLTFAE